MAGLAVIIDWNGAPDLGAGVERMLDLIPHRASEGRAVLAVPGAAFGHARRVTTAREAVAPQLLRHGRAGWIGAGDLRLDDRAALAAVLGRSAEAADLALVLAAYELWGMGTAERLAGDFAFVLWDPERGELYAARDAFGVRPLYYRQLRHGLALASEVGQLLALGDRPALEDAAVLEYLIGRYGLVHETFYRGVRRVPPGHALRASVSGLDVMRWFQPPALSRLGSVAEADREARRLLRAAVAGRLEADRPLVSQLSGGLDSTAIACLADVIYREDGKGWPPLRLASAVFPGLPCDESSYLDAVAARIALPIDRYDGAANPPAALAAGFEAAFPWRTVQPAIADGWSAAAARLGGRVVLSGFGGDEVLTESGVFRDLAERGRLTALWRATRPGPGRRDALRAALPAPLRRAYRRLRPIPPAPPPPWLGPRLAPLWGPPPPPPARYFASHTQAAAWASMTAPALAWNLELEEQVMARRGVQLRFPWLDVRLARFALAMPYDLRVPEAGRLKVLLRRSLADVLPAAVAGRAHVTTFEAVFHRHLVHHLGPLRELFFGPAEWRGAPYVAREPAQRLLEQAAAGSGWQDAKTAWDIAMLEVWLRGSVGG